MAPPRSATIYQPRPPTPKLVAISVLLLLIGGVVGRLTAQPTLPATPGSNGGESATQNLDGPTRSENGVPTGFANTEAGAIAAATAYTSVLDGSTVLSPDERDAALDVIAASQARDRLGNALGSSSAVLEDALGLTPDALADPDFVARAVPAGYRVVSLSPDAATVEVWGTAVFVAPGRQASSNQWSTVTVELAWERDDWKLVARRTAPGPTPPAVPAPQAGLGRAINAFAEYTHVPIPD